MKVFVIAVLVAIVGGVAAEYLLSDYLRQDAVKTFSSQTARP